MNKPQVQLDYQEPEPGKGNGTPLPSVLGLIKTVDAEPTGTPRSFFEQFRIYNNALYWYNTITNAWQTFSAALAAAAGDDHDIQINVSDSLGVAEDHELQWYDNPAGDGYGGVRINHTLWVGASPDESEGGNIIKVQNSESSDASDLHIVGANGGSGGYNGGSIRITAGAGGDIEDTTGSAGNIFIRVRAPGDGGLGGNIIIEPENGDIFTGTGALLAADATRGFLRIPTIAGEPTGTPEDSSNPSTPIAYDTANDKLWIYNGSWKSATFT
jgi:hypothetical protein